MSLHCLACKHPIPGSSGDLGCDPLCPCPLVQLGRFYGDDCSLVSCAGSCGRAELFPEFLNVGSYLCTECVALVRELLAERSPYE